MKKLFIASIFIFALFGILTFTHQAFAGVIDAHYPYGTAQIHAQDGIYNEIGFGPVVDIKFINWQIVSGSSSTTPTLQIFTNCQTGHLPYSDGATLVKTVSASNYDLHYIGYSPSTSAGWICIRLNGDLSLSANVSYVLDQSNLATISSATFIGGFGDFLTSNLLVVILTIAVLFGIGFLIHFTKRHIAESRMNAEDAGWF